MAASRFAPTPEPPYYAVIFTNRLDPEAKGYEATARRMLELALEQPGFLGAESVRDEQGVGITVSYWQSEEAIAQWRRHADHRVAQQRGRQEWYEAFCVRVARVERAYGK